MKILSKICIGFLVFGAVLFIAGIMFGGQLHVIANGRAVSLGNIFEYAKHEIVSEFNETRYDITEELYELAPIIGENHHHEKGW